MPVVIHAWKRVPKALFMGKQGEETPGTSLSGLIYHQLLYPLNTHPILQPFQARCPSPKRLNASSLRASALVIPPAWSALSTAHAWQTPVHLSQLNVISSVNLPDLPRQIQTSPGQSCPRPHTSPQQHFPLYQTHLCLCVPSPPDLDLLEDQTRGQKVINQCSWVPVSEE